MPTSGVPYVVRSQQSLPLSGSAILKKPDRRLPLSETAKSSWRFLAQKGVLDLTGELERTLTCSLDSGRA